MLETPRLRDSIEQLYAAFAHYPLRENTERCCGSPDLDPQPERRLHVKSLRDLSHDDLWEFASSALYTWGNEGDFKHFLPRLFELVVHAEDEGVAFEDPQAIFHKLTYADWNRWPVQEKSAVVAYFEELWDIAINTAPDYQAWDGVYGWIEAISQAEPDITHYLEHWMGAVSAAAHHNLARMIMQEELLSKPMPGLGTYWSDAKEQLMQLVAWVRRPQAQEKLQRAIEQWKGCEFSTELVEANRLLQELKAALPE
jgi:hypothetical protein